MQLLPLKTTLLSVRRRFTPPRHPGLARLCGARDRGGAYVLRRQRADGGVAVHFKGLSALQVCGYSRAANRLCEWIRHRWMGSGEFRMPPFKTSPEKNPIYPASWIVTGAHRLGQFDISRAAMDFLAGFRDARTGGFYCFTRPNTEDAEQELIYVGYCGLAALYAGRLDVAEGVGDWMRVVMDAQPNFPEELYTVYTRGQGLITLPPPERRRMYVVTSQATDDQLFFQPGAASAFLAHLFQASGDERWLTLAMEYMRFAEVADDHLFRTVRAGKVGWAAALLYSLTGQQKYREMAIRVGDNLIALQKRSGCWYAVEEPVASTGITAEMVLWLDEICQAVDA